MDKTAELYENLGDDSVSQQNLFNFFSLKVMANHSAISEIFIQFLLRFIIRPRLTLWKFQGYRMTPSWSGQELLSHP